MKYGILGKSLASLGVSRIGLGCMSLSEFYGPPVALEEGLQLIRSAYCDYGINFFDTADIYGTGANEELLGKAMATLPRDKIIVATKCGLKRDPQDPTYRGLDGSSEYIHLAVEKSLQRLQLTHIDLFYLHRVDPKVPFEESIHALAELGQEGKVRAIGLSEVTPTQIKIAHAIHPITAVQTEYSLWFRTPEMDGVIKTCQELGISFVPYSPLGRGFLAGAIQKAEDVTQEGDFRGTLPRFKPENFVANLEIVRNLEVFAHQKGITTAQLALAWLLHKGDAMFPIPGTTKPSHLASNAVASEISLSHSEIERLERIVPIGCAKGTRFPESAMKAFNYSDDTQVRSEIAL